MTELKPCPFCGSEDIHIMVERPQNIFRHCYKAMCFGCQTTSPLKETEGMAVEAWNRRFEK